MAEMTPTDLNFGSLPPYRPRTFVPAEADLTLAATVTALYQKLLDRPAGTAAELERWLLDRSELEAALAEVGSILYIRMTCQTDDAARAEAYRQFVETVEPAVKPLADALNRKYLAERAKIVLDQRRYEVHDRGLRADVELFRQENVPLQTEEALASQEYQTVSGAMTVSFQGRERTLPEMARFLLEPNRTVRESAWRATAARRLVDRERLEEIFERLFKLRTQIAVNAGCRDYADYQFRAYHRFDYTPEDCRAYHRTAERCIVPLVRRIMERRRGVMGLDRLRPWDTSVDPEGRAPLKPFAEAGELAAGARAAFSRTDPELGRQFEEMERLGLLDLASRKGKAPGGYQSTLYEARKPFIFMNAVGVDRDVRTLLHEGGHAFHALAAAGDPLLAYQSAPMEISEVASMGMELLADGALGVFYGQAADVARSRREHLEGIVAILPWVATIDAFQHWLYSHPEHSAADRRAAWIETYERFSGGVVDWSGLEAERACRWHAQLHIFQVPFYYIEYAIAQLGALQLWVIARRDQAAALAGYKRALALGGSRPLPELFAAAGIRFDFSESTIAPLMAAVDEALAGL
jgi:oligoendopeptidase F